MNLKSAIQNATTIEKQTGNYKIVYQVFENNKLIYVGIGGSGKRKGSGRLKEHLSDSVYSSFRQQYYIEKWILGYNIDEAHEMWDALFWDVSYFNQYNDVKQIEEQIIKDKKPKFNRK